MSVSALGADSPERDPGEARDSSGDVKWEMAFHVEDHLASAVSEYFATLSDSPKEHSAITGGLS